MSIIRKHWLFFFVLALWGVIGTVAGAGTYITTDNTAPFNRSLGAYWLAIDTRMKANADAIAGGGTGEYSAASAAVAAYLTYAEATNNGTDTIKVTAPTSVASDRTVLYPDASGTVILSTLATNAPGVANSVTGGTNQLIFEGAAADNFEAIIDSADATADTIWRLPVAAAGTYGIMSSTLVTNALDIANSVTGGTGQLVFEGSSADSNEHIIQTANATSDVIWLLPVAAGTDNYAIMVSTLETNNPDLANSVSFASNQLIFEGAGVDAHENIIQSADATSDVIWFLPVSAGADSYAFMASTLVTNAPDIANSVSFASNQLIFEGSSANDFEAIIQATNPTADTIWLLPVAAADSYAIMGSTLETNAADIANSVTGSSNALHFEGATGANGFQLILTPTDPTADRTVTFSDASGTPVLSAGILNAAHSILFGNSTIIAEGSTAGDYETTLSFTDPTADNTLSIPDDSGGFMYAPGGKTTLNAGGAVVLTHSIIEWTTTGGDAGSLADGEKGQILTVVIVTDGGTGTITPSGNYTGWATVVLADDIDSVTFLYVDDTVGWIVLGTSGDGANAAAVTQ